MAVSQGSSQALQVLNSLLVNQRQERRSDNELALTALSYGIKRDEANEKLLRDNLANKTTERDNSLKALRDLEDKFAISGGTEKSVNEVQKKFGLQSDAYAVVGQYKMRIADEHKTVKESIGGLNQQIKGIEGAIDAYSKRIGEQSRALATAAVKHFDEADVSGDDIISSEEFKKMGFSEDTMASIREGFNIEEERRLKQKQAQENINLSKSLGDVRHKTLRESNKNLDPAIAKHYDDIYGSVIKREQVTQKVLVKGDDFGRVDYKALARSKKTENEAYKSGNEYLKLNAPSIKLPKSTDIDKTEINVIEISSGQEGTIETWEYDPKLYKKINKKTK